MHFSHSFYLTVALDVTLNLQPTMTHLGRRVYTAPKSWENSEWEILLKWEIHEKYCFHFIHYWTNIENTSLKFHWITYLLPDNACLHINSNLKQTTITETLPDLCFWRYINKLYYKQNNIIACNEGSEEGQRTKEQHSHLICDLSYSGMRMLWKSILCPAALNCSGCQYGQCNIIWCDVKLTLHVSPQLRTALQAAKHEDRSKGLRCGKQFDLEQMKWRHWGWSPFYISDQRGRLNSQFTTSASARTSSFLFVVSGKWSVFHFNKAAFISKGYRKGFCYSSPFKLSKLKRC